MMLAVGLVCALAMVLLYRVVLLGDVLLPADIVLQDPAWATVRPPGFTRAQNGLISDQIRLFYVTHDLAARSLQSGHGVPLWNPYAFAGQPLVGNAQSALYYPPNLLLRWLPATTVAGLRVAFLLVVGGVFAYLYARCIGTTHLGACVAATSFVLGGPFVVWLGFPLANVLAFLPFLLWTAEGLIRGRAPLAWTSLGAAGIGVAILGGHPETSFQVCALYATYALARAWSSPERVRLARVAGCVAAAGLLGGAVGAVQLLPFLDALHASSTIAARHDSMSTSLLVSDVWLTDLATAPTLLYPTFYGTPVEANFFWPFHGLSNYNRQTVYFGALALALAAAAVAGRRATPPVTLLATFALVCLGIAWRLPLLEAVNHLPVVSLVRNDRLRLPFAFFGAILAGIGFDALRARDPDRRARAALRIVLVVTLILPPLALLLAPHVPESAPTWARRLAEHLEHSVFTANRPRSWIPFASAAAASLLLGTPQVVRLAGERVRDVLVLALVAVELLVLAWDYNPSVAPEFVFPETRTTRLLEGHDVPPRVVGNGAFWPNYGTPYGIAQIEAYDLPVPRSFVEIYRAQGGRGEDHHQRWRLDWPLVDLLGVEYAVSAVPLVKQRGWTPVLRDGDVYVYRNAHAFPRAWVVHRTIVERDPTVRLSRIVAADFDAMQTALLDEPLPDGDDEALRAPGPTDAPARVSFASYLPDRVELDVWTPTPGLLVTSEADAPGWQATVDGAAQTTRRANHAFRAVPVPTGQHRVVLTYAPWTSRLGRWLTLAGSTLVVALGAIALARHSARSVRAAVTGAS